MFYVQYKETKCA